MRTNTDVAFKNILHPDRKTLGNPKPHGLRLIPMLPKARSADAGRLCYLTFISDLFPPEIARARNSIMTTIEQASPLGWLYIA